MNKREDIVEGAKFKWNSEPYDIVTINKVEGDTAYFTCDSDDYSSTVDLSAKTGWELWVPIKDKVVTAETQFYYNGTEVFDQMILLYGKEAVKGFCICNAYKYRQRAGKKSDNIEEDIKKAMWYETKLKELV